MTRAKPSRCACGGEIDDYGERGKRCRSCRKVYAAKGMKRPASKVAERVYEALTEICGHCCGARHWKLKPEDEDGGHVLVLAAIERAIGAPVHCGGCVGISHPQGREYAANCRYSHPGPCPPCPGTRPLADAAPAKGKRRQ